MLKEELKFVRYRIKEYYDRSQLEGPCLVRGDKVYLISRNLYIKRLSRKLDFKKLRPFKIDKYILQFNYRLILLVSMKLRTSTFYISILELVLKNARLETIIEAEDEEEEQDIEEVLDLRITKGQLKYLVKQLDFSLEDNSQQPTTNLYYLEKLVEFYQRNLDRPLNRDLIGP